ncbi:lipopolysaccharide kinase InaA family protein [Winogradskyella luteola]|uniref:Kdo domain containing protein n=1 Tax=Winogradskyella luteola TaxID=2828330 RepID=A0A9X1F787_9FLAO|nr:lipopolysaccharide kinase InaA family protein [Winogradskyella luteola]MBV7268514.1 Kdo domain containing protein [Winogradskyella luteola]
MRHEINSDYIEYKDFLDDCIINFDTKGEVFGNQKRNSLKLFSKDSLTINIKSFKIPNIFNQIVYRFFRKSKAQRSFEYALKLKKLEIGTPDPIAYYEFSSLFLFKKSYYISEQLECDLTYRELINDFEYEDYENILRQFTRFTFKLHEKGIEFLDHSPGNTLITKTDNGYSFALVDLNRMKFGPMDFDKRMKNFARLSKYKHMVEIMSDEYAKCIGKSYDEVFDVMWKEVKAFRAIVDRKKKLKKRLKK